MKITKDTIEHVANLARLNLTEDEKSKLTLDMEQIISYVDKLNELDTSKVKPTDHVIPISNVFREDEAKPSYPREKILENAPSSEDGCFKVPKIVE
ncbi:Asp-tRNA(Asn)/Glu-tRNA(Gln) amidotransferase subunit GatC [Acetivibrio cellulolyticus]|uniref:Asp-tRNA(Asn)/Glu-tRNA(Gln) amidotransferase subunit GatC n=1 Tax=Acetivibrio cellulolyticus TaxID=35830 RepID=UPI0001E2D46F|nr:Asp-tRNA(Asn)/Glu-tRNA(Gln) amidotransferase subunit GatC [Acetivibrio cellulolyticus]